MRLVAIRLVLARRFSDSFFLQTSLQTITSAEEAPHKGGPVQALEETFPTPDCQSLQLQEFAESIAKLIRQVPHVRGEIVSIKAENEQLIGAEKAVSTSFCGCPGFEPKFDLA